MCGLKVDIYNIKFGTGKQLAKPRKNQEENMFDAHVCTEMMMIAIFRDTTTSSQ